MQLINPRAIYPGVAGERLGVGEDGKTAWVEGNLDSLVDVDLTTTPPVDGDVLLYDDTLEQWVPGAGGGGASNLDDLLDVDLTGLADGDVIVYDLATTTWVPAAMGGGYTDEQVRDVVAAALVDSTYLTLTINDPGDTITLDVDTTAIAELIRDTIATALVDGGGIDITVNDGADTITLTGVHVPPFSVTGVQTVTAYTLRWYAPVAFTVSLVRASVGTAPTGASLIVDVLKNGTTLFTGGTDRPTIAASGFTDTGVPAVTSVAAGDYLTVSVVQIGSTVPGSDLTIQVVPA